MFLRGSSVPTCRMKRSGKLCFRRNAEISSSGIGSKSAPTPGNATSIRSSSIPNNLCISALPLSDIAITRSALFADTPTIERKYRRRAKLSRCG